MQYFHFDQTKKLDVVLLGRAAIDFNPVDVNKPLSESTTFKKYVGGSPANIATGLAVLGKKVGFISKVSNDQFGTFVTDFFASRGIDVSQIAKAKHGETLGLTFTEIKSPTESSILMYRENVADLNLEPSDVSENYIKQAKMLVISGTSLSQSPTREAALLALEYAKKHGVVVLFDVDFRNYTWKNKYEISLYYSLVAKQSDIIMGSREEFSLMEEILAPGNDNDLYSAQMWHGFGSQILVIKHGKEGSTLFMKNAEPLSIKPVPTEVLKSFGGGDGYGAAFIYSLLEGLPAKESLLLASAAASMLVAAHSCSEAMPTVAEIHDFIENRIQKFGLNKEDLYG